MKVEIDGVQYPVLTEVKIILEGEGEGVVFDKNETEITDAEMHIQITPEMIAVDVYEKDAMTPTFAIHDQNVEFLMYNVEERCKTNL